MFGSIQTSQLSPDNDSHSLGQARSHTFAHGQCLAWFCVLDWQPTDTGNSNYRHLYSIKCLCSEDIVEEVVPEDTGLKEATESEAQGCKVAFGDQLVLCSSKNGPCSVKQLSFN